MVDWPPPTLLFSNPHTGAVGGVLTTTVSMGLPGLTGVNVSPSVEAVPFQQKNGTLIRLLIFGPICSGDAALSAAVGTVRLLGTTLASAKEALPPPAVVHVVLPNGMLTMTDVTSVRLSCDGGFGVPV